MESACCDLWGMIYAGNVCIVSRSPQALQRRIATVVDIVGAFDNTVWRKRKLSAYQSLARTIAFIITE